MRFMKKNLKILLLAVFVAVASCSFTTKGSDDPEKDKLLLDLITYVIEKGHFNPQEMDDTFSAQVYTKFIDGLDPLKRYFLASDLEEVYTKPRLMIRSRRKTLLFSMPFISDSFSVLRR